jgi:pimeloyl-ACP methyl ester carboxylesterase
MITGCDVVDGVLASGRCRTNNINVGAKAEMPAHTEGFVTVDNCRVRLMRGGSGTAVLFLHGGGGAGRWLPCMDRLAAGCDLIVPEHPGFGQSETPPWLDTVADLANFYLDFLDELDLHSVHLVGHSLGGWIAAELAVRDRSRLASLTLVASAGIHVNGVEQVDAFLRNDEQRIRDLFHDQTLADTALVRAQRPEGEDIDLKNRMATAKLVWQPRSHDPQLQKWLHRIDVPTLLIWGEHDRLFPKEHAFAYERLIPGAKAVIIPECGHLPHVEKADIFATELAAFIGATRIAA